MVINSWPEPEIIEVQIQKIKEIRVEPQKSKIKDEKSQKASVGVSFKQQAQKKQLIQKCQKLQKDYNLQKSMKEAHQMLIGLGRSQNVRKAIEIYTSIPEMNQTQVRQSLKSITQLRINPNICNILGCLHEQGKYMVRDLKKAVQYYIKSASTQDPEGMYKIGKFLQKKLVNSKELFEQQYADRKEQIRDAIEYYQKAAQKGHLDAITDLGHIYQNGIKLDEMRQEKSVVSNSEVSNSSRGSLIIQPNLDYAIKYYQIAKKQEFPRALNNLGALYIRMADQIPETMKGSNLERGIKYLKRASEHQYPKAYLNLGKCFQCGLGVKANIQKAKALYIQGSDFGDNQCKLQLVKCLLNHQVKYQGKSDLKMVQYLRQIIVSDPNIAQAQHLMGVFYEKGIAVEMSPQNAFYHINKAAKLQYPLAIVKMGDYYYSGYYVQKDLTKAKSYYEKAASKGLSQGFINIGLMYQKGMIQTQNKSDQAQKTQNYLLQAAKMGNSNAFIFLNKQPKKQNMIIKEAAELGSEQALKLFAKINSTAQLQAKSVAKSKAQYGALLNRFVKELKSRPKQNQSVKAKRSPPPLSQKMRGMMIFSPRSRVQIPSQMASIRFNSPLSCRLQPSNQRQPQQ